MELFVIRVETTTGSAKYLVVSIESSGNMVVIERFDDHLEALSWTTRRKYEEATWKE